MRNLLYYINNCLPCEQIIADTGRAATRSDRLFRRTHKTVHNENYVLTKNNCFFCMSKVSNVQNTLEIWLWSNLFVCTVEKIVFYIQNCGTSEQRKLRS